MFVLLCEKGIIESEIHLISKLHESILHIFKYLEVVVLLYNVSGLVDIWRRRSLELLRGNLRSPILNRRRLIQGVLSRHNLLRSGGHLEILGILFDYKLPE
jgi:hypothetical protein